MSPSKSGACPQVGESSDAYTDLIPSARHTRAKSESWIASRRKPEANSELPSRPWIPSRPGTQRGAGLLVKYPENAVASTGMLARVKIVAAAAAAYVVFQPLGWVGLTIGLFWVPEYFDIGFTAAEDPVTLLVAVIISLLPVLAAGLALGLWGSRRLGLALPVISVANIMFGVAFLFSFWTCSPC